MIICHCNRVTDRTIREVAEAGARDAVQVARACGAGACCGGCRDAIREILVKVHGRPGPDVVQVPAADLARSA